MRDKELSNARIIVVIELAGTYTRHEIYDTNRTIEDQCVYSSEKHAYCLQFDGDGTLDCFGTEASNNLMTTESNGNGFYYFNDIISTSEQSNIWILKDIFEKEVDLFFALECVFLFHTSEVLNFIKTYLDVQSVDGDIKWVVVLPSVVPHVEYRLARNNVALKVPLNLKDIRCCSITEALTISLNRRHLEGERRFNQTSQREILSFVMVYLEQNLIEVGTYDMSTDGSICCNSRETIPMTNETTRTHFEKLLQNIFTIMFFRIYKTRYACHYEVLCTEFKEQINRWDNRLSGVALNSDHIALEAVKYFSMPMELVLSRSRYSDRVSWDPENRTIVVLEQHIEQIIDSSSISVANILKKVLQTQHPTACFISGDECVNSLFRQKVHGMIQNDNSCLIACNKRELISSKFTYGYTTSFRKLRKEQHSEENNICLSPANSDLKTTFWLFKTIIQRGQQISTSTKITWIELATFYSNRRKVSSHQTMLLRSNSENPIYINEAGCEVAATIQVRPPPEGWPDEVEFQYTLAITKHGPTIVVTDLKSNKTHSADLHHNVHIDFIHDSEASALVGAKRIGLNQANIAKRAQLSYGILLDPPFKEGEHPEYRKYYDIDGNARCLALFYTVIKKGQRMPYHQVLSCGFDLDWCRDYKYIRKDVSLYCTTREYFEIIVDTECSDAQCFACLPETPDLETNLEVSDQSRFHDAPERMMDWDVQLIVEEAGLLFKVIHKKTGIKWEKQVDF